MRNRREMERHTVTVLDKPAKERIAEEADTLFYHFGVNVPLPMIAQQASTNQATVIKYFGSRERLVSDFLKARMKDAEAEWREIERDHPTDPLSQLRAWMSLAEISSEESSQSAHSKLSRSAAELFSPVKNPLLSEIEAFWRRERRQLARLCEAAKLRDPAGLADKLLLLVHGARNERGAYGYKGPGCRLREAADDLMVIHGAPRKPASSES
jgi:AcrR family transcriptional regulator